MAKSEIIKVKIKAEIEVPFYAYDTKRLNEKAKREIKRWIKETLNNQLSYIPLWVEKDEYGTAIEDCAKKSKIKVSIVE